MGLKRNKKLKTWLASTGESRGIQAPGACGPGLQGAWGPGPQGLGPGPYLSNYDFFANLLAQPWRRRGCRLKRLLWRWGPGGKRSRDTPPTPPPPPPLSPGAVREKSPASFPGSPQEVCDLRGSGGFCGEKAPGPWWAGPQALGARAPSPLKTWPTGPWGLDPATLTDFLQAKFNFLLRLKPMGPGLKTLP